MTNDTSVNDSSVNDTRTTAAPDGAGVPTRGEAFSWPPVGTRGLPTPRPLALQLPRERLDAIAHVVAHGGTLWVTEVRGLLGHIDALTRAAAAPNAGSDAHPDRIAQAIATLEGLPTAADARKPLALRITHAIALLRRAARRDADRAGDTG